MDQIIALAKTPFLQDKRFLLAVGAILALLLSAVFKINVTPEKVAAIVALVLGTIVNSAVKEAVVVNTLTNAPATDPMALVNAPDPAAKV